jgi:hypothetical protein
MRSLQTTARLRSSAFFALPYKAVVAHSWHPLAGTTALDMRALTRIWD